jgi:hypothetical protein
MSGELTSLRGEMDTRPIADRNLVLYDESLLIHRRVRAGQPVPRTLLDAYRKTVVEGERAKPRRKESGQPSEVPESEHEK